MVFSDDKRRAVPSSPGVSEHEPVEPQLGHTDDPGPAKVSRKERTAECVRELTRHPDFPAFSELVRKILTVSEDEEVSIRELGNLISREYSLTLRLLRMANSYNRSNQPVLSISRAIIIMGMQGVRNLASSLLIFEHFHNKSSGVRELMLLSMLTANHVRQLAGHAGLGKMEEAYLSGMIRNLGEILVAYYHPAQYASILKMMETDKLSATTACLQVLHFTFEDLAEAVAAFWGMPEKVATCHRYQSGSLATSEDGLFLEAVALGHWMTTAVYRTDPGNSAAQLRALLRKHHETFRLTGEQVEEILANAIGETKESFAALGVGIDGLRLHAQTKKALEAVPADCCGTMDEADGGEESGGGETSFERMAARTCTLLNTPSDTDLNSLILAALETIHRGGGFDRVVFAFLNQEQTHIQGRMGFGEGADDLVEQFRFRASVSGGPVSVALMCRHTILTDAVKDPANPVPALFGQSFVGIFPIVVAHKAVGCVYVDNANPRPGLTGRQLELLEKVRQALTAAIIRFQQRSGAGMLRIA